MLARLNRASTGILAAAVKAASILGKSTLARVSRLCCSAQGPLVLAWWTPGGLLLLPVVVVCAVVLLFVVVVVIGGGRRQVAGTL